MAALLDYKNNGFGSLCMVQIGYVISVTKVDFTITSSLIRASFTALEPFSRAPLENTIRVY